MLAREAAIARRCEAVVELAGGDPQDVPRRARPVRRAQDRAVPSSRPARRRGHRPVHARRGPRSAAAPARTGKAADIDTRDASLTGTASVWGELDIADALDLEAAVQAGAEQLKACGSPTRWTYGGRRRWGTRPGQGALDLTPAHRRRQAADGARPRQVVIYAHLSDGAIAAEVSVSSARLEKTRSPVTAEQVRGWCAEPTPRSTVKPVIDLNERVQSHDEVPDAKEHSRSRRPHLCLPFCTRTRPRARQRPHPPPTGARRADVHVQHRALCGATTA